MQKQNQGKSFAFKLAEKQEQTQAHTAEQWKVRDGVALAGCTGPDALDNFRDFDLRTMRMDSGVYC